MDTEQTVRRLQDKITACKTTLDIYNKELEECESDLEQIGVSTNSIERMLKKLNMEITRLDKREKRLLKKADRMLKDIEERTS